MPILSTGTLAHPYNMAAGTHLSDDLTCSGSCHAASCPLKSIQAIALSSPSMHTVLMYVCKRFPFYVTCIAGAAWQQEGAGRVVILGSAHMFDDEWLGKEDNEPLLDFLVGWLLKVRVGCWTKEAQDVWNGCRAEEQ